MRYVAFLRAINVGGRVVKMDALRRLFDAAGFAGVETFIASGNVLFDSTARDTARLEARIEQMLQDALGYRVATFVRSAPELAAIAKQVPDEQSYIHVGFLKAAPSAATRTALLRFNDATNALSVRGRELYWRIEGRFSESGITAAMIEKALGGETTLRNAATVRKLAAKC